MQILLYTNLGKSLLEKQSALLYLHVHMCLTLHTYPNTTLCVLMNIAQQPWLNDDLSLHQALPCPNGSGTIATSECCCELVSPYLALKLKS